MNPFSRGCQVCGKQFERHGRQLYCSPECYIRACSERKRLNYTKQTAEDRQRWAKAEARTLMTLIATSKHNSEELIDTLTEYIYNNYKQRKG